MASRRADDVRLRAGAGVEDRGPMRYTRAVPAKEPNGNLHRREKVTAPVPDLVRRGVQEALTMVCVH